MLAALFKRVLEPGLKAGRHIRLKKPAAAVFILSGFRCSKELLKQMQIKTLVEVLDGEVVCGEEFLGREVTYGFASDLMSDVLTLDCDRMVLLTGLTNLQTIRTAEMGDIECIVFVRNKKILPAMKEIASENDMVLIQCRYSMFKAVSLLYEAGLKPVY